MKISEMFTRAWPKELSTPYGPTKALVTDVHDGDTITVLLDPGYERGGEIDIRIYGINAPELNTPEGKKARDFLTSLLPLWTPVRIIPLKATTGEATRSFVRYVASVEMVQSSTLVDIATLMVDSKNAIWCDRNLKPLPGPAPHISIWRE